MIHKYFTRRFFDCSVVFVVIFFIQFKSILSSFSLDVLSEFSIVFSVSIGLIYLLAGVKVNRKSISILLYVGYIFSFFLLSGFMSEEASYIAGMLGFLSLAGMVVFWIGFIDRVDQKFVFRVFLLFGCLNAIGAFINYFISPTIFGLIHHSVYTDAEVLSRENVTQRAVSFIVSPQSLSLFLSVCFVLVGLSAIKLMLASVLRLLFFSAIILTASKAAFVFLLIYYMVMYFDRPLVWIWIFCFLFGSVIIFYDKLERVLYVVEYLQDLSTYSAFPIWTAALNLSDGVLNDAFGMGLGIISRGAQEINDYVLGFGSTESFVLQLFVEIGYVGLFLFLLVYFFALILVFSRDRGVFSILVALLVVSLFTPTLYGFTSAIYFYYFLVSAVCGSEVIYPRSIRSC